MPQTPPPVDFKWINDTLSYVLDPIVVGLKIEYKKEGDTVWHPVFESSTSAPTSCPLNKALGPNGTVKGRTKGLSAEPWGADNEEEITNRVTEKEKVAFQ